MLKMEFIKLLEIVEHLMAALFLIVLLVWLFGQTWIREWIKGRFSEAVGKQLESHKHELARDLEAHKTSLLRELEQYRANVDLKRAIALQTANAQTQALQQLHFAFNDDMNMELSCTQMPDDLRRVAETERHKKCEAGNVAYRSAEIYLPPELAHLVAKTRGTALNWAVDRMKGGKIVSIDDPKVHAIMKDVVTVCGLIRAEIKKINIEI